MRVEDVDVVETKPLETLVETRQHILARAPFAVGSGPHVVAGLCGDDELVAIAGQVSGEKTTERLLRRAVRWTVVVGQVKVRNTQIERAANDLTAGFERPSAAEVLPQAKRNRR